MRITLITLTHNPCRAEVSHRAFWVAALEDGTVVGAGGLRFDPDPHSAAVGQQQQQQQEQQHEVGWFLPAAKGAVQQQQEQQGKAKQAEGTDGAVPASGVQPPSASSAPNSSNSPACTPVPDQRRPNYARLQYNVLDEGEAELLRMTVSNK